MRLDWWISIRCEFFILTFKLFQCTIVISCECQVYFHYGNYPFSLLFIYKMLFLWFYDGAKTIARTILYFSSFFESTYENSAICGSKIMSWLLQLKHSDWWNTYRHLYVNKIMRSAIMCSHSKLIGRLLEPARENLAVLNMFHSTLRVMLWQKWSEVKEISSFVLLKGISVSRRWKRKRPRLT